MHTRSLAGMLVLVAALAAPAASAAALPTAFGTATSGSFNLTSGVVLAARSAELKGVWLDDTLPCSESRTLEVSVEVFYSSRVGATKRKRLSKAGSVANCAEGGPNFGFLFRARRYGFACPNGTWRPGSYSFLTATEDVTTGLTASASLSWQKTGRC